MHRIVRIAKPAIGGAILWGVMMGATALFSLLEGYGRALDSQVSLIVALYAIGGFLAFLPSGPLIQLANRWLPAFARFLFAFLMLTGSTLAATAAVLALDYRTYYAEWHDALFTRDWFMEQLFTAAASTYQYLVIGTRFYWPFGVLFLLAASWHLSRKAS